MKDIMIYEITAKDMEEHPIWYFPLDESVHDEQTIRPFNLDFDTSPNEKIIVSSTFTDNAGNKYNGFIYWFINETVESLQPVIFLPSDNYITFWNGIIKPSWDDIDLERSTLKQIFPITFSSKAFPKLKSISGTLEGLYYIDDNDNVICIKP